MKRPCEAQSSPGAGGARGAGGGEGGLPEIQGNLDIAYLHNFVDAHRSARRQVRPAKYGTSASRSYQISLVSMLTCTVRMRDLMNEGHYPDSYLELSRFTIRAGHGAVAVAGTAPATAHGAAAYYKSFI